MPRTAQERQGRDIRDTTERLAKDKAVEAELTHGTIGWLAKDITVKAEQRHLWHPLSYYGQVDRGENGVDCRKGRETRW